MFGAIYKGNFFEGFICKDIFHLDNLLPTYCRMMLDTCQMHPFGQKLYGKGPLEKISSKKIYLKFMFLPPYQGLKTCKYPFELQLVRPGALFELAGTPIQ